MSSDLRAARVGEIIKKTVALPAMPQVAERVLVLLQQKDVPISQVVKAIESDPGISSQIMKVVNSSFYGLPRKVHSLQQAVSLLGFNEIRNLVAAAASRSLYRRFGPAEQRMWIHATKSAVIARLIAMRFCTQRKDLAFLAGQMHDCGAVVLHTHLPAVRLVSNKEPDEIDRAVEAQVYGFTHADVGALLMQQWNMPAEVEAAAFLHHEIDLAVTLEPEHADVVALVAVADLLAHDEMPFSLPPDILGGLEILAIDRSRFDDYAQAWRAQAKDETASMTTE